MFKEGVDGLRIGKYIPEHCFREAVFKGLIEFFPYVIAREAIVG